MGNLFAELQMLSRKNHVSEVEEARKKLNDIVSYFKRRPDYLELVTLFADKVRNLEVSTLLGADSFMVQDVLSTDIPQELRHDSYGFCRGSTVIFDGRYVYPVKDVHGDVMGFCGYDMFSDTKYLDSKNYGYVAKRYSVWGMESMQEYYTSTEPVFFVEGIVCALYLRQCGLQSLALLGSMPSRYVVEIIRRFGMRAVVVIDSDDAGLQCRKYLKRVIPNLRVLQSSVAKDIDDSRKVEPSFAEELRKLSNPFYRSPLFY